MSATYFDKVHRSANTYVHGWDKLGGCVKSLGVLWDAVPLCVVSQLSTDCTYIHSFLIYE